MDKVLFYLLKKSDFVSGEEISKNLSLSRTAVWKHINMVRERGFEIDSIPGKGYILKKIPEDKIIPELIFIEFEDMPCEIKYFSELDSTNNYAKREISNLSNKDYVLIAEKQTKGRGRFDRSWESYEGKDLTFSLIIHPAIDIKKFYTFTIIASLAVYKTLEPFLNDEQMKKVKIKWPNDLYYENKKICGILSEIISEEALLKSLIIGIGINVNSTPEIESATSLYRITNKIVDRNDFLSLFLKNFYQLYKSHNNEKEWEKIFLEWKNNLKNLGEIINFRVNEKTMSGKFLDVNIDGSLVIKIDNEITSFYAGEFL